MIVMMMVMEGAACGRKEQLHHLKYTHTHTHGDDDISVDEDTLGRPYAKQTLGTDVCIGGYIRMSHVRAGGESRGMCYSCMEVKRRGAER